MASFVFTDICLKEVYDLKVVLLFFWKLASDQEFSLFSVRFTEKFTTKPSQSDQILTAFDCLCLNSVIIAELVLHGPVQRAKENNICQTVVCNWNMNFCE